jgi:hypothetical protein
VIDVEYRRIRNEFLQKKFNKKSLKHNILEF